MRETRPGSCFGYQISSPLAFNYLRDGAGEDLTVTVAESLPPPDRAQPLMEWLPRPGQAYHARLYQTGPQYQLWVQDLGWYEVDPRARRIRLPDTDEVVLREERLWGIPAALCFLEREDLPLHAAAGDDTSEGALARCQ